MKPKLSAELLQQYRTDGVVCIRGAFEPKWLDKLAKDIEEILTHPERTADQSIPTQTGRFFNCWSMRRFGILLWTLPLIKFIFIDEFKQSAIFFTTNFWSKNPAHTKEPLGIRMQIISPSKEKTFVPFGCPLNL